MSTIDYFTYLNVSSILSRLQLANRPCRMLVRSDNKYSCCGAFTKVKKYVQIASTSFQHRFI